MIEAINADSILAPNIKQDAIDWINSVFDAEQYFNNSIASRDTMATEVNSIIQRRQIGIGNNMITSISLRQHLSILIVLIFSIFFVLKT